MGSKTHSLIGWLVSFLAICLGIAVYSFGVWNTWGLLSMLIPGDWLRPALGVALFDFGMVVWFGVFVYHSRGLGQRGIALIAGVLSLVGMLLSNWYFLTLSSGQTLVKIGPEDGLWALRIVEYGIIVAVCSGVLHYLLNPEILERMRQQAREDKVMDQAAQMADRKVDDVAAEVADQIGDDMRESALRKLAALNSRRTLTVQGRVIESRDARPAPPPVAAFASAAPVMPRFVVGAAPSPAREDGAAKP